MTQSSNAEEEEEEGVFILCYNVIKTIVMEEYFSSDEIESQ